MCVYACNSGNITKAASCTRVCLCTTVCICALQAAHAQSVHKVLGEAGGEDTGLLAVLEVMLDLTESSVAFCWELGAGQPFWHPTQQDCLCSTASILHQLKCLERVSSSARFHITTDDIGL